MMFKPIHFFRLNLVILLLIWVTGVHAQEMIFPGPPAGIRNTDLFNVKLYGAVGNGIVNDTVAIQAALNAVSASGGSVYVPCGTYKLTAVLRITTDNTRFYGDGPCSLLSFSGIADAASGQLVGYIHVYRSQATMQRVRIEGLHIKGDTPRSGTTPSFAPETVSAITFGQATTPVSVVSNSVVAFNDLEGFNNFGFMVTSSAGVLAENNQILSNYIHDANGAGINAISGTAINHQVIGNHLTNLNGIAIEWASDGALISENHIHDSQGPGINTEGSAAQTRWSTIANNVIDTVGLFNGTGLVGNGIQLGQSFGWARTLVKGNILRNIAGHGITTAGTSANCTDHLIVGNSVQGWGTSGRTLAPDQGQGAYGINMRNCTRVYVVDNAVRAVGGANLEGVGIDVAGGSFTGSSSGNVVTGTLASGIGIQYATGQKHGINFDASASALPMMQGGTAASVTVPAVSILNDRMLTWYDAANGTTNAGFLWYDSGNNMIVGAGNSGRARFGSTGNVTIGGSETSASAGRMFLTAGAGIQVGAPTGGDKGSGAINASAGFYDNNVRVLPALSGTTGSIGGSALIAGQCSSGTATVTGSTTSMVALADPNTYPGDGIIWDAQVTSANTVTVKVCAIVALTPTSSTYNVRVLQ